MRNPSVMKTQLLFIMYRSLFLSGVLFLFLIVFKLLTPWISLYIQNVLLIVQFLWEYKFTILISAAIALFMKSNWKALIKRLAYYYSEETTDEDLYNKATIAWKLGKFDECFDIVQYMANVGNKHEQDSSTYTKSARAIMCFQQLNYQDNSSAELQRCILSFLNNYDLNDKFLSNVHLAFGFARIASIKEDGPGKSILHLFSACFFQAADQTEYAGHTQTQMKLFTYQYTRHLSGVHEYISANEIRELQKTPNLDQYVPTIVRIMSA